MSYLFPYFFLVILQLEFNGYWTNVDLIHKDMNSVFGNFVYAYSLCFDWESRNQNAPLFVGLVD